MNVLAPFGFLTRVIPARGTLEDVGRAAFLFPAVGAVVGLVVALAGWVLSAIFPPLLAAALTLGALYGTTGILHLDGLADFADGLATSGNPSARQEAMRTGSIGAAGLLAASLLLLTQWGALAQLLASGKSGVVGPLPAAFGAILTSEIGAKLAMNFAMGIGRPARSGMASTVMSRFKRLHLLPATGLALGLSAVATSWLALFAVVAWVPTAILVGLAHRSLGNVTGDVLGAVNEVGRATGLSVWTVALRTL